jgi:hypothetical protein
MPPALITDCGAVAVGAGPVLTTVPAGTGSTFSVRNAQLQTGVFLTDAWRKSVSVGQLRIVSPNLVPVANGIRVQTPAGLGDFLLQSPPYQALIPQDALTVSLNGTAAEVGFAAIQTYYENLPGGGMILKNPGDINGLADFNFGWPVAAAASATAGNQNSTLITTTVDSSSANTWYALIGIETDVTVGAIGISGVDTSQFFCGAPGDPVGYKMNSYFADLSVATGKPCIPMFNSANKGSTNVVVADNIANTAVNVTMILAQMPASYQP